MSGLWPARLAGVVLIAAVAGTVTPALAITVREPCRIGRAVRVYQTAGLSAALEQRALTEAEDILAAAGVDVRWHTCLPRQSATVCGEAMTPGSLALRIVRQRPSRDAQQVMGDAIVGQRQGGGVLATVYFDRIADVAEKLETDVAVLLGRVAAHELGHLLMDTSAHTRHGLMRARWSAGELRRNLAADWAFTAADVAAMRQLQPTP